jgi:hypothetical protein
MHDKQDHTLKGVPVANYGSAIARALEWLGDRYLLAKPINTPRRLARPPSAIGHQRRLVSEDR